MTGAQIPADVAQSLDIRRNDARSRFEGRFDDVKVAEIDFAVTDRTMSITHTGTRRAWRGRSIAAAMTRFALDDARSRGLLVVPVCPYTARFIDDHTEYADLLA